MVISKIRITVYIMVPLLRSSKPLNRWLSIQNSVCGVGLLLNLLISSLAPCVLFLHVLAFPFWWMAENQLVSYISLKAVQLKQPALRHCSWMINITDYIVTDHSDVRYFLFYMCLRYLFLEMHRILNDLFLSATSASVFRWGQYCAVLLEFISMSIFLCTCSCS